MHDGMQYDTIQCQGQGHEPFKVGNSAIFRPSVPTGLIMAHWPPKARPLFHRCYLVYFFYFVGVDERPVMRSQPNLASGSEVVSIYKYPLQILGSFWGSKIHQILDHFLRL